MPESYELGRVTVERSRSQVVLTVTERGAPAGDEPVAVIAMPIHEAVKVASAMLQLVTAAPTRDDVA